MTVCDQTASWLNCGAPQPDHAGQVVAQAVHGSVDGADVHRPGGEVVECRLRDEALVQGAVKLKAESAAQDVSLVRVLNTTSGQPEPVRLNSCTFVCR